MEQKRLYRTEGNDKMLCGVCGGVGEYFNVDPNLVRVGWVLLSLFTCGIGAIVMFIWGIVDGVRILDGRINTDANGVFLKD